MTTIDLRMPTEEECFLCRKTLGGDRSVEHVYPKWFLRSHKLWDGVVDLPNGTTITYSQFRIPCCVSCNGGRLSGLESAVKNAFDGGVTALRALSRNTLFQWSCKIGYGTLLRMTSLDGDRRRPEFGRMIPRAWLANHRALRLLLETISREAVFIDESGYSLFVFEAHRNVDPKTPDFDFFVGCSQIVNSSFTRHSLIVSIVHNGVGMFCVPLDGGACEAVLGPLFSKFRSIPLYRSQYLELLTRLQALETIRRGDMTYSLIDSGEKHLIFPISPAGPVFGEWDHDFYLKMLRYNWEFSRIAASWAPGRWITSLCWPDGAPIIMSAAGQPTNSAEHWPIRDGVLGPIHSLRR